MHSVNQKTSKGGKKMKKSIAKHERRHCHTGTGRRNRSYE